MATTHVSAYIHMTFWKKKESPQIRNNDKAELFRYIGGIIKNIRGVPVIINGTKDHLHILSTLPKTVSLATFAEEVKKSTSKWIKQKDSAYYKGFYWQAGYGVFTVDSRKKERLVEYIRNQEAHHEKITYREEFEWLLEIYGIEYNQDYLCE